MLIDAGRSQLLVIDFQEKMLPALADGATLLAHCCWVIAAAQKIGVPVAATEQYPKGLGPLVPEIRELLQPEAIAEKARFSAVAAQCLANLPGSDRAQVIGSEGAPPGEEPLRGLKWSDSLCPAAEVVPLRLQRDLHLHDLRSSAREAGLRRTCRPQSGDPRRAA